MLLDAPCMSLSLTALVMLLHIPSFAFFKAPQWVIQGTCFVSGELFPRHPKPGDENL